MRLTSSTNSDNMAFARADPPAVLPPVSALHAWLLELINLVLLPCDQLASERDGHNSVFLALTVFTVVRLALDRLPELGWAPHHVVALLERVLSCRGMIKVRQGTASTMIDEPDEHAPEVDRPLHLVALDLATAIALHGSTVPINTYGLGVSPVCFELRPPWSVEAPDGSHRRNPCFGVLLVPLDGSDAKFGRNAHWLSLVSAHWPSDKYHDMVLRVWLTREWFAAHKQKYKGFLMATDSKKLMAPLGPLSMWTEKPR